MWISLGNHAEVALIFAQTDPEKRHRGIACFLVPTEADGYDPQEIHGKLGLRAADTAAIGLNDVEVGDDALLGEVGEGFKVAMSALDSGRYSVAAGCVGICQGCVDASTAYATERKQFDQPIAGFQLVQEMIADMVVRRDAARMLVRRAGWLKDAGEPSTLETSIAKLYATEASVECANLAIQVHGGSGYVDDYPVERYLRDARVTTLYEGTSQIQKLIIGRATTGIDAMTPADDGGVRRDERRRGRRPAAAQPPRRPQRALARGDGGARRGSAGASTPTTRSAASSSPAPTRSSPPAPTSASSPSASSPTPSFTRPPASGSRSPSAARRWSPRSPASPSAAAASWRSPAT